MVGETSGRISGSVSVGVFGPQMDAVSSLQEFMDAHPDIRVTLDARQRTATARVTREFDAVFYPEGPSFEGIAGIPYAHCRTLLALPSSHPLAIADSVDLAQVKDEPFIFMNTTAGTYERTYRLCLENGFSPRVRAVTSSGVAQMRFIAAGLGVGLVDAKTQQIGAPGVHLVCVRGATPDQVLCFATRPVELLSPAARELLEHLLRRFEIPNDERVVQRFSNN